MKLLVALALLVGCSSQPEDNVKAFAKSPVFDRCYTRFGFPVDDRYPPTGHTCPEGTCEKLSFTKGALQERWCYASMTGEDFKHGWNLEYPGVNWGEQWVNATCYLYGEPQFSTDSLDSGICN